VVRGLVASGLLGAAAAGAAFVLRPTPVTLATAAVRDLAPAIQGVGTLEAKVLVQVSPKITGRLVAVLADQGDEVRAGQVLAHLDRAEHRAEVQRAEAAVQRARLAAAAQEVAVRRARAGIESADAGAARVRAAAGLARLNAERWRRLHAEGGVSRVELDVRTTEAATAEAELRSAEAQRRAATEELGVAQATLATLRQEVRVAEAALAATRAREADTQIVSPLDGLVVSRELEAGATAAPGAAILKIADPRSAWVTVHVDEREVGSVGLGQPALVALRSMPGRSLRGRVARIHRESDRVTEQLAVDIALEERPDRLTLGEQAEATIRPPARRGALTVPLGAVIQTAQGPGAWTVAAGRLAFRPLRLGAASPEGWVEVRAGLREGEPVVVAPGRLADLRHEGHRVRARTPAAGGARTAAAEAGAGGRQP